MNLANLTPMPHISGRITLQTDAHDPRDVSFRITHLEHETRRPGVSTEHAPPPPLRQHPAHDWALARQFDSGASGKLRSIPIKVLFDAPSSNVLARYEGWSQASELQPTCLGDGQQAKAFKAATGAWEEQACRGPDLCPKVRSGEFNCSASVRALVRLAGYSQRDIFELKSNSENTLRSLLGDLTMLHASGKRLSQLKMTLTTWRKSLRATDYEPFGCVAIESWRAAAQPKDTPAPKPLADAGEQLYIPGIERPAEVPARQLSGEAWEEYGRQIRKDYMDQVRPTEQDRVQAGATAVDDSSGASRPLVGWPATIALNMARTAVQSEGATDTASAARLFAPALQAARETEKALLRAASPAALVIPPTQATATQRGPVGAATDMDERPLPSPGDLVVLKGDESSPQAAPSQEESVPVERLSDLF